MHNAEQKQTIKSNFLHATLLFAVATIPLWNILNSIALEFFILACAIRQPVRITFQQLRKPSLWMLPAAYFVWLACSYFWDSSGGYRGRDIERYATLFFIPACLGIVPKFTSRSIGRACMLFVAVTVSVCLAALIKSYIAFQANGDYRMFFYHYLGNQVKLNAIFLSNYCLASIIWLLYFAFLRGRKFSRGIYVFISAVIIFLFGMVLLLSSKLIIFLMLLMLMGIICYTGYLKGYLFRSIVIILVVIGAGVVAVGNLSYVKWRVDSTTIKKYSGKEDDDNGLSIRMLMWSNAWELIGQRPVLGYGVRGARQQMVRKFKDDHFDLGFREGYHSHSQYFESALMGGIPAFILFIAFIFFAASRAVSTRNVLLVFILFHFICQSFIESVFEVQQELVFYIFFIFLFYYHSPSSRETNFAE